MSSSSSTPHTPRAPNATTLARKGFRRNFDVDTLAQYSSVSVDTYTDTVARAYRKRGHDADTTVYELERRRSKRRRSIELHGPPLGSGTWGDVYASTARTVVKVQKDDTNDAENVAAFVGENYVHSVICSDAVCSAFVPRLHRIFVDLGGVLPTRSSATDATENPRPSSRVHLCSQIERLRGTGAAYLDNLPDYGTARYRRGIMPCGANRYDQRIIAYIAQIANALHHLQQRFHFNHCDLMPSNTMYQRTRAKSFNTRSGVCMPMFGHRHQIIDFGFSSLKVGERMIVSPAFLQALKIQYVHKSERDLMQLIFSIVRDSWRKLHPDILIYFCNLLTVTHEVVNYLGFVSLPQRLCFWRTQYRDTVRFHTYNARPIVVRRWRDIYNVVGDIAFHNPRTWPQCVVNDIAGCIVSKGKVSYYDVQCLSTVYSDVHRPTVVEYFTGTKT